MSFDPRDELVLLEACGLRIELSDRPGHRLKITGPSTVIAAAEPVLRMYADAFVVLLRRRAKEQQQQQAGGGAP